MGGKSRTESERNEFFFLERFRSSLAVLVGCHFNPVVFFFVAKIQSCRLVPNLSCLPSFRRSPISNANPLSNHVYGGGGG
jgi:hypothetical protein